MTNGVAERGVIDRHLRLLTALEEEPDTIEYRGLTAVRDEPHVYHVGTSDAVVALDIEVSEWRDTIRWFDAVAQDGYPVEYDLAVLTDEIELPEAATQRRPTA